MFVVGISSLDIVVSVIYLMAILFLAFNIKSRITNENQRRFFIPFVVSKLIYTILFVVIHIFVYNGGDTFLFFAGGNFIADQILANPSGILTYLFGSFEQLQHLQYSENYAIVYSFRDSTTLAMSQVTSLFCMLGLKLYLATSLVFTTITAFGFWRLYTTIAKLYPGLELILSFCVLFYPTLGIWGSGILKDPLIVASIGYMLYGVSGIIEGNKILVKSITILIGAWLCFNLKPYILYTFVPAILLWVQGKISRKLSFTANIISLPIILTTFIIGGFFFLRTVSEGAGKYSLENVQNVAIGFQSWHTYLAENRNQSGYSLGEVEFTAQGVLLKTPEALFVTYYRPAITEIRNFATGLEGIQSNILLLLTIYILFSVGPINFFRIMIRNHDVRSFMLFAILLGVAVGLTSYNFGALSRYKIPCIPFFTASLAIIYYEGKLKAKRLKN